VVTGEATCRRWVCSTPGNYNDTVAQLTMGRQPLRLMGVSSCPLSTA